MANFIILIVIIFLIFFIFTVDLNIPKPYKFSKTFYYSNIAFSFIIFIGFFIIASKCEPCPLTHGNSYLSNHLDKNLFNLHVLSFNVEDFLSGLDHIKGQVDYNKVLDMQTVIKNQIKDTTELQQKITNHKCFYTEYGTLYFGVSCLSLFLALYSSAYLI